MKALLHQTIHRYLWSRKNLCKQKCNKRECPNKRKKETHVKEKKSKRTLLKRIYIYNYKNPCNPAKKSGKKHDRKILSKIHKNTKKICS